MAENNDPKGEERLLLNLDLNADGAEQSIKQLTKSWDTLNDELMHYKDLQKSAMNPADVAKYNQEIARIKTEMKGVNTAGLESANSVKGFKQQLREATQSVLSLANAGKKNTEEYRTAVAELARLRDLSQEVNRDILANDPGNRFQALAKGASLLGQGFAGVTGALSLMGLEAGNAAEITAKLTAIQSVIGMIDSYGDLSDLFAALKLKIFGATEAIVAETVATEANVIATSAQTVATEGQIVATEGATVATKTLGTAMKALGIGAIIALVAYLVTNWDELKKSITDTFPALKDTTQGFEKAREVFSGVTNVLVGFGKAIFTYLIAPLKIAFKLMQGDFSGAVDSFKESISTIKDGLSVQSNFEKGVQDRKVKANDERRKVELEKLVKETDDKIAILKASGEKTEAIERAQLKRKLELAKGNDEELKKIQQESLVFEATIAKKKKDEADKLSKEQQAKAKALADKAKADRENELKEYKKYVDDAKKINESSGKSDREKAIDDVERKYKTEIDLANKLHQSTVGIEKAKALELKNINIKYIDEVANYLATKDADKLSSFDKQRKAINDEIEKLLKNAPDSEKDKLNESRAKQLGVIDNVEDATNTANEAKARLDKIKADNLPDDKDEIEDARIKVENIRNAELDAEITAFNLSKLLKEGQLSELEALEQEHNSKLVTIETESSKAKIALAEREKEAKIANLQTIGGALGGLSSLVTESTVLGKGLSIAQATIDTYAGATKALAQGGLFGYIGAAGIIATGFANIKKITSTKIPNSNASSTAVPSYQVPVINSTVLRQNENGVSNLTSTVSNKNQEPIKAYIVDADLNKQKDKTDLYDRLSSI